MGVCIAIACVPAGVIPLPPGVIIGVPPPGVPIGVPIGVPVMGVLPPGVVACGVSSHRDLRFPPPGVGVIPGVSAPVLSVRGVSAQPGVRPGVSPDSAFGVSSHLLRLVPKIENIIW